MKVNYLCHMACGTDQCTRYEEVTGQTLDISEWLDFGFYDLVWWLNQLTKPDFMDNTKQLAKWLGVSHCVGSDLSYWLITESGKIISKTSVEHVMWDNYLQAEIKAEIDWFNEQIDESLDDANFVVKGEGEFDSMYLEDIDNDGHLGIHHGDNLATTSDENYDDIHIEERPDNDDEEVIDKYLNVELILNVSTNDECQGHVVKHLWGTEVKSHTGGSYFVVR